MVSLLSAMSLFAFVGAVSPGPVNVMATYAGAQFGWRKASVHVLGAPSPMFWSCWCVAWHSVK